MTSTSHSETDRYLLCERQHYYSYGMKLQKAVTANILIRGTAGHAVLEEYYRAILEGISPAMALGHARSRYDLLAHSSQGVGDVALVNGGFKDVSLEELLFDWYFPHEQFVSQGWEVLAVEMPFEIPMNEEGDTFKGIVDLILRDTDGRVAIVDHKFQYDFLSDNDVATQPQLKKYIAALRGLGFPADYAIYNQIRYRKQKDMTSKSQLRLHPIYPNDSTVLTVWGEQVRAAGQIKVMKSLPLEVWSETALRTGYRKVCQGCDFIDLCTGDMRGDNNRILIESEYITKPSREK